MTTKYSECTVPTHLMVICFYVFVICKCAVGNVVFNNFEIGVWGVWSVSSRDD